MKKVMVAYRKDGKWFYKISEDGGETWAEERVLNGLPRQFSQEKKKEE
jgi:Neuraminidase (sialidase)